MNLRFLQLTLILGAVVAGTARAQEAPPLPSLLFGPTAGLMYGLDVASVPVYYTSADCGLFTRGTTLTSSLGGTLWLPSLFSSDFGLLASIRFSYASGRLTVPPSVPIRVSDTETGQLIEVEEEYRLNSASLIASLDLLAAMKLSDRFSLAVGPFVGYRLSSTLTQTENVLSPDDFRFSNGHVEQPMPYGPNPQGRRLLFGPSLAATYTLPFGSHSLLVPEVSLQTDLLSSLQEFSWRSYRAGLSLSLLFDLAPRDSVPPDDPVIPPPPPHLTASVEMYGIDEEGQVLPAAKIQVYETLFQRHAPLLPAVFFERNRADFSPRYVVLDSGKSFSMDGLAPADILTLQRDVLNVVGLRLRERQEAHITLVGSVSRDEDDRIRRSRTATVQSYLQDVWNVAPARVDVREGISLMQRSSEETEDGREDNRRVEMSSEDLSILAPVVTTRVIRDFDPPLIRMKPEFDAEAGVKEWRLVISQGGKEVAAYSSYDDEPDTAGMTWRIVHDRVDSALSPLIATLTVEDSTGAVVTASANLPLSMVRNPRVVDQRIERKGDRERLAYTLVGFEFSSAGMGAQNVQVVKEIADVIRNGAEVEVMGYTDRIGDEQRNRELAMERGINVAKILQRLLEEKGVDDVTLNVSGEGAETERFDNNLPEGRVLSRGVGVVVEQQANGEIGEP